MTASLAPHGAGLMGRPPFRDAWQTNEAYTHSVAGVSGFSPAKHMIFLYL